MCLCHASVLHAPAPWEEYQLPFTVSLTVVMSYLRLATPNVSDRHAMYLHWIKNLP